MNIVPLKDLVTSALQEIKLYQNGSKKIIKTGRPYIDDVGIGLVNGGVVLVAAGSGIGKSFELSRIIKNILDRDRNPDADKYVSLNISLEMRILSLVLRDLEGKLDKGKREILLNKFSEEEKEICKSYYEALQDDRQYISQTPTTVNQFYEGCKSFLEKHKDKESCIISADHLVLISSDKGEGKNQSVENLIEKINQLKMEYPNVIFILLSQTNSKNQDRVKEKDRMSQPKDLDIYYSQFSFQIADYVCVIQNTWKLGIQEYSKIYPDKYSHLEEFFLEEDSKGRVSLEGEGVLYYHLLKCREGGSNYIDIFAERIYTPKKTLKKENVSNMPVFPEPIFDAPKFNTSPKDAFGESPFS